MLMNKLPWFSERREHQGPAETQSRTAPKGREGARRNSLQSCTPRCGAGREGLSPREKAALSNLSEQGMQPCLAWGRNRKGVEGGGGRVSGEFWNRRGVGKVHGSLKVRFSLPGTTETRFVLTLDSGLRD